MSRRLAYLVARYPKLSETFVADEIEALERQGEALDLYALVRGRDGSAADHRTPFVPGALRCAAGQLHWLLRAPTRLLGLWGRVLWEHRGSGRALLAAAACAAVAPALASRMRRRGTTHVHAQFATHAALVAWAVRRLAGISYSFTAHADDVFVRRPMLGEKVRDAAFVVTISAFNRRFLVEQLGAWARPRIEVLHCGVSTQDFAPLPPPKPPSAEAPFTLLCVGRLEEKKGQVHLVEACRLLAQRGIDFRCLLVGEGSLRPALERARDAAGLGDRLRLLGAQPRARIAALLEQAHVFALPSVATASGRADGIPVALMEAMALARPVVSTRTSGIPELIEDGRSGLLVPPGDAPALADALARLHAEPETARALAEAAHRRVRRHFDLDANVARLRGLFGEAMGEAALPRPLEARIGSAARIGEAGP